MLFILLPKKAREPEVQTSLKTREIRKIIEHNRHTIFDFIGQLGLSPTENINSLPFGN